MSTVNQAPEDKDLEVTPQHRHKQKLIEAEAKRKKQRKVVEQFLEIISDHHNPKGGKVRLCKRMSNGNLHRHYLGREKQVADIMAKYKAQGMKVIR